ncbi:MAG: phosphoribosyltransferase [Thermoplasmata archaeon]|nr:phosphoribosyltransferase [Thermoplasmata archaeon]
METIKCQIVKWEDIEKWVDDVVEKIRKANYRPDVVIGLTRGGWIPARLICDELQVKSLYAVKTEHWGLTATKDGQAKIAQTLPVDVRDKNVLIVDDITDTGQSLSLAKDHVASFKPSALKTATLLHITHSTIVPDFYSVEVPKEEWTWFIFPWNFNEDIQSLVSKALNDVRAAEEIKEVLKKHCQITVDEKVIYNALLTLARKQ